VVIERRPESVQDQEFLFELYVSVRFEEFRFLPWTDEQKRALLRMQFNAQRVQYRAAYPDARFDVVVSNRRRAGRFYVVPLPDEIRIVDISLFPEFRRQGIGTQLLRDLILEADDAGLPLGLHVEQANPALHWYENFGFQVVQVAGPYMYMLRPTPAV
jgi:ribosomal protein S18 acetylase RimI-like enzyme